MGRIFFCKFFCLNFLFFRYQISSESSDDGLLSILLAALGVDVLVKLLLLFSLFFFLWTRLADFESLSHCRFGFSAFSEDSASELEVRSLSTVLSGDFGHF